MYKRFENNKGITLIALVITIIILLILAGVTISALGDNGLFEKAKLAKEKQENAENLENLTLSDYENKIDRYINSNREENTSSNNFIVLTSTFSSNVATFSYPDGYDNSNTYIISAKALRQGNDNWWYERYSFANNTKNKDNILTTDTNITWELIINGVTFTDAKILITKVE